MPTNLVRTKKDEELWSRAKARAAEQGHKEDWAYVNGIYQRMKGNTKKTASLLHAITSLGITQDMHATNAPIHRAEGDEKQAELCDDIAKSCGVALTLLDAIQKEAFLGPLLRAGNRAKSLLGSIKPRVEIPGLDEKKLSPEAIKVLKAHSEGPWDDLDWTDAITAHENRTGRPIPGGSYRDPYAFRGFTH